MIPNKHTNILSYIEYCFDMLNILSVTNYGTLRPEVNNCEQFHAYSEYFIIYSLCDNLLNITITNKPLSHTSMISSL